MYEKYFKIMSWICLKTSWLWILSHFHSNLLTREISQTNLFQAIDGNCPILFHITKQYTTMNTYEIYFKIMCAGLFYKTTRLWILSIFYWNLLSREIIQTNLFQVIDGNLPIFSILLNNLLYWVCLRSISK